MQIIHHMTIDMARRLPAVPMDAVQGEGNTRALQLTLLENGQSWAIPADAAAAVAFRKADGARGLYDTLPDGTGAVTVEGNTLRAVLAPQMLDCSGQVAASVVFYDGSLNQLATFPFAIRVAANPAAGQSVSGDYYKYSTMEAVSQAVEAALADVREAVGETTPAIVCEASGETVSVADAAHRPIKGLTLCGRTTQNGTPAPDAPVPLEAVGQGGSVTVTVAGKNLAPPMTVGNGINSTSGTDITSAAQASTGLIPFHAETTYIWSNIVTSLNSLVYFYNENGECVGRSGAAARSSFVITSDVMSAAFGTGGKISYIRLVQAENANLTGTIDLVNTKLPMLNLGSVAEPYEPYKGQSLTVSTGEGLYGMDSATDEMDLARGVRVSRIGRFVFTGNEAWEKYSNSNLGVNNAFRCKMYDANILDVRNPCELLCNYFPFGGYVGMDIATSVGISEAKCIYLRFDSDGDTVTTVDELKAFLAEQNAKGTPVTVEYVFAEPVETALSAGELAQFAALQSCKPTTTVINDSGAGMKLSYVADTKLYIDQKLDAISQAILNA